MGSPNWRLSQRVGERIPHPAVYESRPLPVGGQGQSRRITVRHGWANRVSERSAFRRDELVSELSDLCAWRMAEAVPGVPDLLVPITSRFPLSPSGGRLTPSSAAPSGPATRPFELRYAERPAECGKHSKKPTSKTRTKPTKIPRDGEAAGYEPDTEHYVEMDGE